MKHKMLGPITLSLIAILIFPACHQSDSKVVENAPVPQAVSCSLEGSWERCSDNGGNSTRVRLMVIGTALQETIEEFNSNGSCTGTADSQFSINAVVTLAALGQSTFISGGTDVDLTPDVDFAGCGAGQPLYTVLKFDEACDHFQTTTTGPTCDPTERGNSLDPAIFTRQ